MDKTVVMAEFSICGDNFNLSSITSILGVEPTETRTKGIIPEKGRKPSVETSWSVGTKEEESWDINNQLNQIIILLKDKQDLLCEIKSKLPVNYVFGIVIKIENNEKPAMHFEAETLKFISDIGADIDIDLYIYS